MTPSRRMLVTLFPFLAIATKSPAKLREGHEIFQSFDARDWARDFVAHAKAIPTLPLDEGAMIGWFANALMRGYDEACRRDSPPPTTTEAEFRQRVTDKVVQGWQYPTTQHKEMDSVLAEAIIDSVMKLHYR